MGAYSATRADRIRLWLREQKARPCTDCGTQYPYYVMQFDHRPGEVKKYGPADLPWKSWNAARLEIAKCDVVCANCHAARTYQRATYTRP